MLISQTYTYKLYIYRLFHKAQEAIGPWYNTKTYKLTVNERQFIFILSHYGTSERVQPSSQGVHQCDGLSQRL